MSDITDTAAGEASFAGRVPVRLWLAGWRGFRAWRKSRPFWAGIFLIVAGAELLLIPLPMNSMGLILHIGTGGVLGILIGALLIACALLLWFNPSQRMFYSIVAVLLAVAALVASNLGGFLLGTILGVIGGSLGFGWTPLPDGGTATGRRRWRRRPPEPDSSTGIALVLGDDAHEDAAEHNADAAGDDAEASTAQESEIPEQGTASPEQESGVPETEPQPADDDAAGHDAEQPAPQGAETTAPDRAGRDDAVGPPQAGYGRAASMPAVHGGTVHGSSGARLRAIGIVPVVLAVLVGVLHLGTAASVPASSTSASTVSACASPSPTAGASPSPSASPTSCTTPPTAAPAATSSPSPSPSPSASAGPSASPSVSPSPTAPTGTTSASPSPSPSPSPLTGSTPGVEIASAQSTLTASSAVLTGLAYDGLVSVPTASGPVQMMQFTFSSLSLSGVTLTATQGGTTMTTQASGFSLSGNVVLYATSLSGDLAGVPITITPSTPLADILQAFAGITSATVLPMTNVVTEQPYASADSSSISGLAIS